MKKGAFGYLQRKRTVSLVLSCLLVAAVFIIYYAALRHFQTNKNVFTILAAVMALPAGRSVVITVMCLRAKSASEKVRDAVAAVKELPPEASGFDLCLTTYDRTFSLSHASAAAGMVAGLTEDSSTDCFLCGQHIEKILAENGISGRRIEIFREPEEYIRQLRNLVSGTGAGPGRTEADPVSGTGAGPGRAQADPVSGAGAGFESKKVDSVSDTSSAIDDAGSAFDDTGSAFEVTEEDRRVMQLLYAVAL